MPDIVVVDSITHLTEANRGAAVLAASHGGDYAGYFAAKMGVGAVVFSDAGIGLDFPYPNFTGPATAMGLQFAHAVQIGDRLS